MTNYPSFTTMLFGIPLSGRNVTPEIMMSFHSISMPLNTNMITLTLRGMAIADARNHFAEQAVLAKAKYLLFWDEDVIMPPQTYRELIYRMEHYPDCAVIGAVYCLKNEPPEPLVFKGPGQGPYYKWKLGEVFQIWGIGMGATVIRVDVFKDLPKPWFRTANEYYRYLDGVPAGEAWTEDLWFCDQIAKCGKGWKVYCDGSLLCTHVDLATGKGYSLPGDCAPLRAFMTPKGKKRILDLGCGKNPLKTSEGRVVTLEKDETCEADYHCDCRRIPFDGKTFDVVHARHLLEFIPRDETQETIQEWIRVLKPKGELRIVVPNLDWIADQIKKGEKAHEYLFGKNGTPIQTAFTPKDLEVILKPHFAKVNFSVGPDITVQAIRDK